MLPTPGNGPAIAAKEGANLLRILDLAVAGHPADPDLLGTLGVGVRASSGETTWGQVELGFQTPKTRFVDEPSVGCRAKILLGDAEARSIVETGQLPDDVELACFLGDRRFVLSFIAHYLETQSLAAIRSRGR